MKTWFKQVAVVAALTIAPSAALAADCPCGADCPCEDCPCD